MCVCACVCANVRVLVHVYERGSHIHMKSKDMKGYKSTMTTEF